MKITIIGIDDNREQFFRPEVLKVLQEGYHFSGGKRHYEIIKPYLPSQHEWIEVVPPMGALMEQYRQLDVLVVIASCDPLFNGIGETIMRHIPEATVKVYPSFHSLQMLAHRALLPYQSMHEVTLTGRPWHEFDRALIQRESMIGLLLDRKEHTPATVAQRMLDYGYDNYTAYVGELLGNQEEERVSELSLSEVAKREFSYPYNMILVETKPKQKYFGIPDEEFHLLNGRAKMLTKSPIRLLSLSMLELNNRHVFWDIGSCTGSVSIEAKLQFPHLHMVAFEIRPEGAELLFSNSKKFGTPGIDFRGGDFCEVEMGDLPKPDCAFIGGHGGKLVEIVQKVWPLLPEKGLLVFNSVSQESQDLFRVTIEKVSGTIMKEVEISIDNNNPIRVMKAIK